MIDQPSARLRLAAELAVALSQFMHELPTDFIDDHGFIFHMHQGPFDEDCFILWELGVAMAAPPAGDQPFTWEQGLDWEKQHPNALWGAFKFMPAPEMRAIIMAHDVISPELTFRLLVSYLISMNQYGLADMQLDVGREPFTPPPIFQPQIDALIDCGYLVRSGTSVSWTDRIAIAMQVANFWDAPAVIIPDEAQAQVEDLIRSGQRIAAVCAIQRIAKVGASQAQAHVNELERALQRTDKIAPVMRAEHCWDDSRPQIKTLPHDVQERVNILVQDRNPIAAIALVRAETGAGLVECKAYVDDLARKSHPMPPHRPRR
jgi:ribosomal protein L7/L12